MYYNKYIKYKKKYMELQLIAGSNNRPHIFEMNNLTDNFNIFELWKYCFITFNIPIKYFQFYLKNRKIIDFTSIHNIDNDNFKKYFISNELKLDASKIIFNNCITITIESINMFLNQCPKLEVLNIINSGIYLKRYDNIGLFDINREIYLLNNVKNLCISDNRYIGNDILESLLNNTELVQLYLDFYVENNYFDENNNFMYIFKLLVKIIFNNKKLKQIYLPEFNYSNINEYYLYISIIDFISQLLKEKKITQNNFDLSIFFDIKTKIPKLKRSYKMHEQDKISIISTFTIDSLDPDDLLLFNRIKNELISNTNI
jgi:hypothetical protein